VNFSNLLARAQRTPGRGLHITVATDTGMLVWGGHYFDNETILILNNGANYLAYHTFYMPLCMKND